MSMLSYYMYIDLSRPRGLHSWNRHIEIKRFVLCTCKLNSYRYFIPFYASKCVLKTLDRSCNVFYDLVIKFDSHIKLIAWQTTRIFMNRSIKKSRAATQTLDVIFFFIIEKINPLPNDTNDIHYRYFGFIFKNFAWNSSVKLICGSLRL